MGQNRNVLLEVFTGIIDNVGNNGRNIVIIVDGGSIIWRSPDVMINI